MMKWSTFSIWLILATAGLHGADYDPKCDPNEDGVVDDADLFIFQEHWHGVKPTPTPFPGGVVVEIPGLPASATPLIMMSVPGGTSWIGSTDGPDWSRLCYPCEQPMHLVTIGYDFYIGKYEVTQAQWYAVMGWNPSQDQACGENCPVESVSWDMCQMFISTLNGLDLGTFRLPSEVEWEHACRAGTTSRFFYGVSDCTPETESSCDVDAYAWWRHNAGSVIYPVGGKLPNPWGLHDIIGNVWEWCEDDWHDGFTGAPTDGAPWIDDPRGENRVVRGGHYANTPAQLRSSTRFFLPGAYAYEGLGFRLMMEAP